MTRFAPTVTAAILFYAFCAVAARGQQPPDLNKILADIRAHDTGQLAISEEDGRFLRILIAATGRRHALEIGGASGYSAIWMAQGLRATGGRLLRAPLIPSG